MTPPSKLYRDALVAVDRAALANRAEGDERVPIAISSEIPVQRYDFMTGERYAEVLDHAAGSVDLSRAASGLAFLLGHDSRDQFGIVEDVTVDADRKLRGVVRFSRAQRGQEIRQDMLDGIRTNVSVGYVTGEEYEQTKDANGAITRRYLRWTPYEVSSVPIPADPTVGVGRSARFASDVQAAVDWLKDAIALHASHMDGTAPTAGKAGQKSQQKMMDQMTSALAALDDEASDDAMRAAALATVRALSADPTVGVGRAAPAAPPAVPDATPASVPPAAVVVTVAETARVAGGNRMSIDNAAGSPAPDAARERAAVIMDQAEAAGVSAREARELVESGKSVREVAEILFAKARTATVAAPAAPVTLTANEQRTYSMVRALNVLAEGKQRSGFEFEVSDEIAKRAGKETQGVFVPTSLSASRPDAVGHERTQLSIVAGAGKGVEAKFTEYGGFIDLLRNNMVTVRAGAQFLSGLQGDISFVNQSASGTFAWGTETASPALSSLSTASRTMAPKVGTSATSISRQLLRQSVLDVENLVRQDIAAVHALAIDLAAIHGTGAASQPTGIGNVVGIGSVVGGVNGAQPTYENLVDLQKEVAIDNALAGNLAYVAHPLIAARLMKTQQFASTNGVPVWTGSILEGQAAGFRAFASTQVVSGVTKGTSTDCSTIFFGDWSSLMIGEWGAMELVADPYTLGIGLVKVSSIQMIDVLLRYPQKFAVMADARI